MKRSIFCICILVVAYGSIMAQTAHDYLRAGDQAFDVQDYEKAAGLYEGADREESSSQAKYNKGNALYQMGKFTEAAEMYEHSLDQAKNEHLKFRNYHNMGNAYAQQKEFQKAVDAYQNALKVNPNDLGTKKNLVRALRQIPPQQRQQQEQEQSSKEENKDDKKNKEQQAEQSESKDQKQESEQRSETQSSIAKKDLSEEEMQRLLKAVEHEDQSVQKKIKKKTEQRSSRPVKDW